MKKMLLLLLLLCSPCLAADPLKAIVISYGIGGGASYSYVITEDPKGGLQCVLNTGGYTSTRHLDSPASLEKLEGSLRGDFETALKNFKKTTKNPDTLKSMEMEFKRDGYESECSFSADDQTLCNFIGHTQFIQQFLAKICYNQPKAYRLCN